MQIESERCRYEEEPSGLVFVSWKIYSKEMKMDGHEGKQDRKSDQETDPQAG